MSDSVPVFGAPLEGREHRPRAAVYAVIRDAALRIAAVRTSLGFLLPGGGLERGETLVDCLRRELREECARPIAIERQIGLALEFFETREGAFEGRHVFFEARFVGEPKGVAEYELAWLEHERARELLHHRSHAWALDQ
ncbi:MAG TPA: NUDIX domain-containing protein [Myxococcota bacterium]|nr:NUDIX domain-containing protein [Myxococcota bacterium]